MEVPKVRDSFLAIKSNVSIKQPSISCEGALMKAVFNLPAQFLFKSWGFFSYCKLLGSIQEVFTL